MIELKNYPPYLDYPKPHKSQTNAECIQTVSNKEWTSVKDGLPKETRCFLVVLNNEDIDIRVFNSKNEPYQTYSSMLDKFLFCDDRGEWHTTDQVTHWMPLPRLPKGE